MLDNNARILYLFVGLLLFSATAIYLFSVRSLDTDQVLFLDLWRTRHILIGCLGLWLSLWFLISVASSKISSYFVYCTYLLLASLVLAEICGLVGLISYPSIFGQRAPDFRTRVPNADLTGSALQDIHRIIGIPSDPISYRYRTDSRGFRNEIDRDSASIYFLGDSVVVAGLLDFDKTVTFLVEEASQLSTMNIAWAGWSIQEEAEALLNSELDLRDSWVLHFVFEGNDILDSAAYRARTRGDNANEDWRTILEDSLTYQSLMFLQKFSSSYTSRYRANCYIGDREIFFLWLRESFAEIEAEFPHIAESLLTLASEIKARGGQYGIVYVPAKIRIFGEKCNWHEASMVQSHEEHISPLRDQLAAWAISEGIEFLDMSGPLSRAVRDGGMPWFEGDTHPNAEGHQIMAEEILRWRPLKKRQIEN